MEAFITFILIAVAVFWLLGIIGRTALRWWLQKKQNEFARQFGGQATNGQYPGGGTNNRRKEQSSPEGEVKVHGQRTKKVNHNVGDYVEYEEIDVKPEEMEK